MLVEMDQVENGEKVFSKSHIDKNYSLQFIGIDTWISEKSIKNGERERER